MFLDPADFFMPFGITWDIEALPTTGAKVCCTEKREMIVDEPRYELHKTRRKQPNINNGTYALRLCLCFGGNSILTETHSAGAVETCGAICALENLLRWLHQSLCARGFFLAFAFSLYLMFEVTHLEHLRSTLYKWNGERLNNKILLVLLGIWPLFRR